MARPRTRRSSGYLLALLVLLVLAIHAEYWLGVVTDHPAGQDFRIYFAALADATSGIYNPYRPYRRKFIYHPFGLYHHSTFLVLPVAAIAFARPALDLPILVLLDAERLFEQVVAPIGLSVFSAHLVVAGAVVLGYYRAVATAGGFEFEPPER